jgi:uncharacterized membrane protein YfcA
VLRLAAIGLAAGFFGAILGVGGGIIVIPLLVYLLRYDQRQAAATSMGAISITATVGAISYGIQGHLHLSAAALLGIPAAFGVLAGTTLQQRVPLRGLQLLFGAFIALIGIRLLAPQALPFHAIHDRPVWVYAVVTSIGLAGGVLAGLFGVGGGVIFVPTFVLLLGLTQIDAGATSLLAMIPAGYLGTWRQSRYGNLNRRAAVTIGIASIAGVEAGIAIAERTPEATLRTVFGAFLILSAIQIAWRATRR